MSKTPKYLVFNCDDMCLSTDDDCNAQSFDDIKAAQAHAADLASGNAGAIYAIVAPIAFVSCAVGDPVVTPVEDNAE